MYIVVSFLGNIIRLFYLPDILGGVVDAGTLAALGLILEIPIHYFAFKSVRKSGYRRGSDPIIGVTGYTIFYVIYWIVITTILYLLIFFGMIDSNWIMEKIVVPFIMILGFLSFIGVKFKK